MIERRHLPRSGWIFEWPAVVQRVRHAALAHPRRRAEMSVAERVAMREGTERRASVIRIGAERDYFGLPDR